MNEQYLRQVILPEIGESGQKRLFNAHITCIGAGGLGSPVLLYLAAAGIGKITLIEHDYVSISNLGRQVMFDHSDQGRKKGEVVKNRIHKINPQIKFEWIDVAIDAANALALTQESDIIVDCSDNFSTKFLLNDLSYKLGIPLVFGSISQFEGQVSVFNLSSKSACYRCLYPMLPKSKIQNCAEAGIVGPVAGIIGSLQALEVIKLILKHKDLIPLDSQLSCLDFKTNQFMNYKISKKEGCSVCSKKVEEIILSSEEKSNLCSLKSNQYNEVSFTHIHELLDSKKYLILDVREAEEFLINKITGSINIPLSKLDEECDFLAELLKENRDVLICCKSGIRSKKAISLLSEKYKCNFFNLTNGLQSLLPELIV